MTIKNKRKALNKKGPIWINTAYSVTRCPLDYLIDLTPKRSVTEEFKWKLESNKEVVKWNSGK